MAVAVTTIIVVVVAAETSAALQRQEIALMVAAVLNQLVELLEAELKKPLTVEYLPSRGFDVPTNVLCIERARRCLGWRPQVPVSEGLRSLCASISV